MDTIKLRKCWRNAYVVTPYALIGLGLHGTCSLSSLVWGYVGGNNRRCANLFLSKEVQQFCNEMRKNEQDRRFASERLNVARQEQKGVFAWRRQSPLMANIVGELPTVCFRWLRLRDSYCGASVPSSLSRDALSRPWQRRKAGESISYVATP